MTPLPRSIFLCRGFSVIKNHRRYHAEWHRAEYRWKRLKILNKRFTTKKFRWSHLPPRPLNQAAFSKDAVPLAGLERHRPTPPRLGRRPASIFHRHKPNYKSTIIDFADAFSCTNVFHCVNDDTVVQKKWLGSIDDNILTLSLTTLCCSRKHY